MSICRLFFLLNTDYHWLRIQIAKQQKKKTTTEDYYRFFYYSNMFVVIPCGLFLQKCSLTSFFIEEIKPAKWFHEFFLCDIVQIHPKLEGFAVKELMIKHFIDCFWAFIISCYIYISVLLNRLLCA